MDNAKVLGDGISTAGEIALKSVTLYDGQRNRKYNLDSIFLELDLYEDLYSPCLTGTITIVESLNLISGIPILGEELLEIEFCTPTLDASPFKKQFYVTKIENRNHRGDKTQMYVLHFMAVEGITDLNKKLSKAYSGNASDIVKRIYETELKQSDDLEVDISNSNIKFVSPYWSPFQCINFATSRCLFPHTSINVPNYLFYQTNKKFKLKSLTNLFSQDIFMTYFFDKNPARIHQKDGTSVRNIQREYQTIKELYYTSSQDYINQNMRGTFSHKVFGINLFRKQISKNLYNYSTDFNKTLHLDKFPLQSPNLPLSKENGLIESRIVSPQKFDGFGDKSDDIVSKRVSLLSQLEMYKLDLVVWGRTDIEVGMVINFVMNEFKEVEKDEQNISKYDPYYSGKYLITAIQHRITQSRHQMTMQIVKDSSPNQIDFNRSI